MAIKNFHIDGAERVSWNGKVDSQNGQATNIKINSGTASLSNASITSATINSGTASLSNASITSATINSGTVTTLNIVNGGTFNYGNTNIIDTAGRLWTARYNDLAEWMLKANSDEDILPGDIVAMTELGVVKATNDIRKQVVGVYSDTFGFSLGGSDAANDVNENFPAYIPVGLVGRVNVNVVGDILIGDLLTVSAIPGVAMHADDNFQPGTIVGKALETHSGNIVDRISMLIVNL